MDKQKVITKNADIFIDFFQKLRKVTREYNIAIDDIYNMDKIGAGISLFHKFRIIVPEKEAAAYSSINSNREWATLIETVCADNTTLAPFFIIQGKGVLLDLILNVMAVQKTITCTDNGWSDNKKGFEWLAHFMRASKPTKNYKLLILDGHGSHATFAFRHIAYLNRIILLYLPPHTTHKLQPCDVGMFSPLITYYSNEVRNKAQFYNRQKISKREYIE